METQSELVLRWRQTHFSHPVKNEFDFIVEANAFLKQQMKNCTSLLDADRIRCIRTSIRSPNMNAIAACWVQTLITECLDHFICFGERHLRYIVSRFVMFSNTFRPHQGRSNLTLPEAINLDLEEIILKFPTGEVQELKVADSPAVGKIKRHSFLGGLLNRYERVAA